MFELRVDGEVTLALLEEQHAPELFRLLDANRAYLRQWLPWLDANTRREAVLRQREWLYDHFVDHVVYGMLASEWAVRTPKR